MLYFACIKFYDPEEQKMNTDRIHDPSGFVMLADIYWKRKHKKMRFLPMYADKKHKTITFGDVFEYHPENSLGDEQDRIVQHLDSVIPEYNALISEKESLIEDLKSYKKSLIYEVVTGKRRVI